MAPGRFPHSLVLIAAMIVLAQLATYVLPAGRFETEPMPGRGQAHVDPAGAAPLRERLAAARRARGLSVEQFAALFHVSPATVRGWELGPPGAGEPFHPGTHVEATAGALLERWLATGEPPAREAIDAWKRQTTGRQLVVPGTWAPLPDPAPLPWHAALTAVPKGLLAAAEVIFFVFVVGGAITVLRATGAIDALIGAAIGRFQARPFLLVAAVTTLFAAGSSTIGMAEEYMPFVPVLVTLCLALRLDAVVAMGIVYMGAGVGYGAAALNPFTVLIAQDIAGLEPTSGWWFRVLFWIAAVTVGVHHVCRYGARVRREPQASLVRDVDFGSGYELPRDVAMTARRVVVLALLLAAIVLFVHGVAAHGWYFGELTAVFLGLGLAAALAGGLSPNRAAREFCDGAAAMTATALLIGFARAIQVVLEDGEVIHTVIHGVAGALDGTSSWVAALGMLAVQSVCNLFVPSGSGQAYVTMPIMAPLADLVGVSRQTAVLAYQIGDGFTNMIVPTNALLMGMLALARVPYQRWLRFVVPGLLKLYVVAIAAVVVATAMGDW